MEKLLVLINFSFCHNVLNKTPLYSKKGQIFDKGLNREQKTVAGTGARRFDPWSGHTKVLTNRSNGFPLLDCGVSITTVWLVSGYTWI